MPIEYPQDEATEELLLAALFFDSDGGYEKIDECCSSSISISSFHSFHHKVVWESLCKLRNEEGSLDVVGLYTFMRETSVSKLRNFEKSNHREKRVSDIITLADLNNILDRYRGFPIEHLIKTLRDKELLRASIKAGERLIELGTSGKFGGEEMKARAESELIELTKKGGVKETGYSLGDVYGPRIETLLSGEDMGDVFSTGFPSIDNKLGPIPRKFNLILAARPSTGKTTMGFQICANMCVKHGARGVMFSLESPVNQIIDRAISMRSRVPLAQIKDNIISEGQKHRLFESKKDIDNLGLIIDDGRGKTVYDIRSAARRYKKQHGLDFILIDHFGKIRPSKPDRAGIEEISLELDDMKHELDCVVMTLAQFNRNSEREKRKPLMSDMRECGRLEEDADAILMLARREEQGVNITDKRDIFCVKNRDGEAAWDMTLGFNGPIYRFVDSYKAAGVVVPEQKAVQPDLDDVINGILKGKTWL